ncbi:xanthine dehydrogenase family protein subunit M, partial [Candidatus Bathyarchaeota archaeon]|nr:xanthine dehydrogenase family protein subunit M [Candidatus Bathyarchaeota archaeon]
MRPIPKFQYHSPESVSEALSLLVELENASPVIGGSDLMIAMRNGVIAPSHVVDLNEINELNYIKEEAGVIKIGATATHTQVASNLIVAQVHSLVDSVSR